MRAKPLCFILFYLLFLLGIAELSLRLQQAFGPIYDLEFSDYDLSMISDVLNHQPSAESGYDANGIRLNQLRPPVGANEGASRVLFMGDSFMMGYPDQHTIPQFIWEYLQEKGAQTGTFEFLNAGYTSYAPTIYIAQAKKIIPELEPDFVVIDIDESDLIDDYSSYRPRLVLDEDQKIIGVKRSPIYTEKVKFLVGLQSHPLYTYRLLAMWYFRGIHLHYLNKAYKKANSDKYKGHPLANKNDRFSFNLVHAFDQIDNADEKYREEIAFFEKTVDELFETLVGLMGDPKKIMAVYHPHLHHLKMDYREHVWRSYVSGIVERAAAKHGAHFYSAQEDLKKAFRKRPEQYYFKDDMHFNYEGLQMYAELIASRLLRHGLFKARS